MYQKSSQEQASSTSSQQSEMETFLPVAAVDVYKRQVEDCLKAIHSYSRVCFAGDGNQPSVIPVSYTHLDVYKRQFGCWAQT